MTQTILIHTTKVFIARNSGEALSEKEKKKKKKGAIIQLEFTTRYLMTRVEKKQVNLQMHAYEQ
jgi:hypothetical protein